MSFKDLYDDRNYRKSLRETLRLLKADSYDAEVIVYIIKNIITLHNFEIESKFNLKRLILYYFYKNGKAAFSNGYEFFIKKESFPITLKFFQTYNEAHFNDFKQYFDFGKNHIFLSKIIDKTIRQMTEEDEKNGKIQVENVIDFYIHFLHQCFELYSLEGEHFPLFKWLINEVAEDDE